MTVLKEFTKALDLLLFMLTFAQKLPVITAKQAKFKEIRANCITLYVLKAIKPVFDDFCLYLLKTPANIRKGKKQA